MVSTNRYFAPVVAISFVVATLFFVQIAPAQSPAEQYSQALSLFNQGIYLDAGKVFNAVSALLPDDPRPYFFQGVCAETLYGSGAGDQYFRQGSEAELSEKGRLYNVNIALRRVQGAVRLRIEDIRRQTKQDWKETESLRQIKLFGETLDRDKELIHQENRALSAGTIKERKELVGNEDANLPKVAPIDPLSPERQEVPVSATSSLDDENSEDFIHFRDELGQTTLSTAAKKRLQEMESRVTYDDPMDRPTKDGSKFVNIYDPTVVFNDEEIFYGADDPDDMYNDYENGPLALCVTLLEMYTGKEAIVVDPKAKNQTGPGMYPGSPMSSSMPPMSSSGSRSPMTGSPPMGGTPPMPPMSSMPPMGSSMGGYPGSMPGSMGGYPGAMGANTTPVDTGPNFSGDGKNPFAGKENPGKDSKDLLGLFKDDLAYKPPQPAPAAGRGGMPGMSSMPMGMPPGMMPGMSSMPPMGMPPGGPPMSSPPSSTPPPR